MGRSKIKPIKQPNDVTCGPAALQLVCRILNIRRTMHGLISLCKTSRNGTSNDSMIRAIRSLGLICSIKKRASLTHIKCALYQTQKHKRAILTNYLYDINDEGRPEADSGHWAVISTYSPSKGKITVLDSYSGKRKSYSWKDFRKRWIDVEYKRKKVVGKRYFRIIKTVHPQPLFIIGKSITDLPPVSRKRYSKIIEPFRHRSF